MSDYGKLFELFQDPVKFIELCWPDITLYDKQRDILYSLRDNDETVVVAGNMLGKDFIAGLAVVWFFCSRSPCRIVTTSSSQSQLFAVLWGEIRRFVNSSRIPLPIELSLESAKQLKPDGTYEDRSYILGLVSKDPETMQGHHLERGPDNYPRTLVVFDEASGIPLPCYKATEGWSHRKLSIGNPLDCQNHFRKQVEQGCVPRTGGRPGYFRNIMRICAEDSPNVRLGLRERRAGKQPSYRVLLPGVLTYDEYEKRRLLWDAQDQCIGLDAMFYEGAEILLFPPMWLNMAEAYYRDLAGMERQCVSIGVDPAEGGDSTTWTFSDDYGFMKQVSMKTPNTAFIVNQSIAFIHETNILPENMLFDKGGGGQQHADQLRERGYNVRTIGFGEAPTDPSRFKRVKTSIDKQKGADTRYAFKNRRAELYGTLHHRMNPADSKTVTWALPPQLTELRRQLSKMPKLYDVEGRLYLPPKDKPSPNYKGQTIKQILGCSPDEADSATLSSFGVFTKRKQVVVGGSMF